MSEELEVLNLPLSSIFNEKKSKLRKKERAPAGIRRDQTGTTGSRIVRLSAWTICELTKCRWKKIAQVISVIACTVYRYKDRSGKRSLRTDKKKEKHPSKVSFCPEVYHKYNPSPSRLSAGKSLGIKPSPAAKVLYCLSFLSADKHSGSGISCILQTDPFATWIDKSVLSVSSQSTSPRELP